MKIKIIVVACMVLAGCMVQPLKQVQPEGAAYRLLRDPRVGNNRVAVLTEDLVYCYPVNGDIIIVPVGYMTDFASVPGGFDRVLQEYGNSIEAAIVHDWLYAVGEPGKKAYADTVFRYALHENGERLTDRWAKWLGVTVGGGRAYGRASEWNSRFYKPDGSGPTPPPYQRRASAVVTILDDCDELEVLGTAQKLRSRYGSATWAKAPITS